jgi:hypothetical protein
MFSQSERLAVRPRTGGRERGVGMGVGVFGGPHLSPRASL